MTARDKETLKSYFDTGDVPTAEQLKDLIDSIPEPNTNLDSSYLKLDSSNGPLTADLDINGMVVGRGLANRPRNIRIGVSALDNAIGSGLFSGNMNVAVGDNSGGTLTDGNKNSFFGYSSGEQLTSGTRNIFLGVAAGKQDNGNDCIVIGPDSHALTTTDNNSIVIGSDTEGLGSNTTVIGNDDTTDTYLKGIIHTDHDALINGVEIGHGPFANSGNTKVGKYSLDSVLARGPVDNNGSYNSVFGENSGSYLTIGEKNCFFGYYSGLNMVDGKENLIMGTDAGMDALGDRNVILGASTDPVPNESDNSIVIGYNAKGLGSNTTVIGNTDTTKTKLFGVLNLVQKTPSSSSDSGTTGDICCDENYVYSCVAPNTWKRSPLTTW
jgi:hypothetical protein